MLFWFKDRSLLSCFLLWLSLKEGRAFSDQVYLTVGFWCYKLEFLVPITRVYKFSINLSISFTVKKLNTLDVKLSQRRSLFVLGRLRHG